MSGSVRSGRERETAPPVRSGGAPRLHLVGSPPAPVRGPLRLLHLWHLLSLDAPTVAALWTWFIARAAGVQLTWAAVAAMFLAVWMLYVADRLLDAGSGREAELEERHRFHRRHARAFLRGFGAAAVAVAILLSRLAPSALRLYALLAALLAAWLLLIHVRPQPSPRRLPKELAVGVFFAAAVFIPTVARSPGLRLELLPAAVLFAAVCALNCLFVYAWEHPGSRSEAHASTRWGTQFRRPIAWATVGCGIATAVAASMMPPLRAVQPLAAAAAASAGLLLLLDRRRHSLGRTSLRALADAALLTPLLVAPLLWLFPLQHFARLYGRRLF